MTISNKYCLKWQGALNIFLNDKVLLVLPSMTIYDKHCLKC